jgi:hypothetical protein
MSPELAVELAALVKDIKERQRRAPKDTFVKRVPIGAYEIGRDYRLSPDDQDALERMWADADENPEGED